MLENFAVAAKHCKSNSESAFVKSYQMQLLISVKQSCDLTSSILDLFLAMAASAAVASSAATSAAVIVSSAAALD
jgi:hypothetical protein